MSKSKKNLGLKIRYARNDAGVSQKDLGEALNVSDKTISSYEVGRTEPTFEHLQIIALKTHKPLSFFADEISEMNIEDRLAKVQQDIEEIKLHLQAQRHKNMTSI